MKTKIVYTLISSEADIYMEQMLVSVFSLKHFTPDAHVTVVVDRETSKRIEQWEILRKYINEIIPVDFATSIPNKERSRWIKTSLRNLVEGDFLFLDTDTVVTDDLSEVDNITSEIAIVPDLHCRSFSEHPFQNISKRIERLYGKKLKTGFIYFNSGVILCKDTEKTRCFFDEWHKTWQAGKDKRGGVLDQQSLAVVCEQTGMVDLLPDDYNCQILGSIEYLHTAKIVHFFNAQWSGDAKTLSPFFDASFYRKIKDNECLTVDMQDRILHCKSSFRSPSMIVGKDDMCIWKTSIFRLVKRSYKQHKIIFMVMNHFSRLLLYVDRKQRGGGVDLSSDNLSSTTKVRLQFINDKIAA